MLFVYNEWVHYVIGLIQYKHMHTYTNSQSSNCPPPPINHPLELTPILEWEIVVTPPLISPHPCHLDVSLFNPHWYGIELLQKINSGSLRLIMRLWIILSVSVNEKEDSKVFNVSVFELLKLDLCLSTLTLDSIWLPYLGLFIHNFIHNTYKTNIHWFRVD